MTAWRSRWPVLAVLAGAIAFADLVLVLHVIRPDVDPVRGDLSNYAVGDRSGLMAAAFLALGLSLFTTATALLHGHSGNRQLRIGRWFLGIR